MWWKFNFEVFATTQNIVSIHGNSRDDRNCVCENFSVAELLEAVNSQQPKLCIYPNVKTALGSVSWYHGSAKKRNGRVEEENVSKYDFALFEL